MRLKTYWNLEMKTSIHRLRLNGKLSDETFGLMTYDHPAIMAPLWIIVWLDTKEQVPLTGGFFNQSSAENYVKEHHQELIDKQLEKILLINE